MRRPRTGPSRREEYAAGTILNRVFCSWGILRLPTLEYRLEYDGRCVYAAKVVLMGKGIAVLASNPEYGEWLARELRAERVFAASRECPPGWKDYGRCNEWRICGKDVSDTKNTPG